MDRRRLIMEIVDLQWRVNEILISQPPGAGTGMDLTIVQLRSLHFVSRNGSVNLKTLAEEMRVNPSNACRIVNRLVSRGLLSRGEDRGDRRMLVLRVTDAGQRIVDQMRENRVARMSGVLAHMKPEELSNVATALRAMVNALNAEAGNGATPRDEVAGVT